VVGGERARGGDLKGEAAPEVLLLGLEFEVLLYWVGSRDRTVSIGCVVFHSV